MPARKKKEWKKNEVSANFFFEKWHGRFQPFAHGFPNWALLESRRWLAGKRHSKLHLGTSSILGSGRLALELAGYVIHFGSEASEVRLRLFAPWHLLAAKLAVAKLVAARQLMAKLSKLAVKTARCRDSTTPPAATKSGESASCYMRRSWSCKIEFNEIGLNVMTTLEGAAWRHCEDPRASRWFEVNFAVAWFSAQKQPSSWDAGGFWSIFSNPSEVRTLLEFCTEFEHNLRELKKYDVTLPDSITGWLFLKKRFAQGPAFDDSDQRWHEDAIFQCRGVFFLFSVKITSKCMFLPVVGYSNQLADGDLGKWHTLWRTPDVFWEDEEDLEYDEWEGACEIHEAELDEEIEHEQRPMQPTSTQKIDRLRSSRLTAIFQWSLWWIRINIQLWQELLHRRTLPSPAKERPSSRKARASLGQARVLSLSRGPHQLWEKSASDAAILDIV